MWDIKENIRQMVRGIIYEDNSPDHVSFNDQELFFRDDDAIVFFLTDENEFYCDFGKTHSEIKYDFIAKKLGFNSNDEYNDYIENNPGIRSEALEEEYEALLNDIRFSGCCIEGRFWSNNNVIAFWYKIPSLDVIKKILNGIENFTNKNIDINNVFIALDDDILSVEDYFNSKQNQNIDKEKSEELRKLHLMNAEDKVQTSQMQDYLRNKSENTGKKLQYNNSKGEMPMAQWRALHSTSENKNKKQNKKMIFTNKDIKNAINEAFSDLVQHNHIMADYDQMNDYDEDDYKYMSDEDIASQYEDFEITHLEVKPAIYGEGYTGTIEITFPNADDVTFDSGTVDNFYIYDKDATRFGFDNWYPKEVVEKLKEEIRNYINKNLKNKPTTALESKIRQMVQETVSQIGQRYNGEYDRTGMPIDNEDYVDSIDYIIDSVINGNVTQVRQLVGKLTFGEFFDVIDLAREYGCEEDLRKMIK